MVSENPTKKGGDMNIGYPLLPSIQHYLGVEQLRFDLQVKLSNTQSSKFRAPGDEVNDLPTDKQTPRAQDRIKMPQPI